MWKSVRILKKLLVFTIVFILLFIFVINSGLINPTEKSKIHEDTRIAPSEEAIVNNISIKIPDIPIKEVNRTSTVISLKEAPEKSLKLDRRKAFSEETIEDKIALEIPYLPIEDINNPKNHNRNLNDSCAWYPKLVDVKIHNDYWQEYQNKNFSYYIFGAYFDNRPTVVKTEPVVRVLAMINFLGKTYEEYPLTYCHLWYEEQSAPFVTPMKEMNKIWRVEWGNNKGFHYAHFIACPVPLEYRQRIPRTVSLVANPCDKATNNVRVTYQPLLPDEKRKEFVVCLKGLDYPDVDISNRIVEYIETLRTLGAEKITIYQLGVHPNTTKVLEYYQDTGYLEYRPMSLSKEVSSLRLFRHLEIEKNAWSYVLHEVIPYNDCLYRNMYRYKYVAVMDTDELLMPVGNFTNWHDLMKFGESVKSKGCEKFASYCFRCVYFPRFPKKPRYTNDIPEYFYMLQHVERVREHLDPSLAAKCLHSADHVIATHNHFTFESTSDVCFSYSFEAHVAQLNHYREPDIKETLNDTVVDLSLWRMKDEIIGRSKNVFSELGFLSDEEDAIEEDYI